MVISFGNINGAVSSNVYRAHDKPWYRLGHVIVLVYIVIGFVSTCGFMWLLGRENGRRERGERDEVVRGVNDDKVCFLRELGMMLGVLIGVRVGYAEGERIFLERDFQTRGGCV